MRDLDLPELDDVYSCGGSDSPEGWVQLADVDEQLGRLACSIDADGDPQLRCYWADVGVTGFAELRGELKVKAFEVDRLEVLVEEAQVRGGPASWKWKWRPNGSDYDD